MAVRTSKILKTLAPFSLRYCSTHEVSSSHLLSEDIKEAVRLKMYQRIPDLLTSREQARQNPNPFSFLSNFARNLRTQVIDEILQSLVPLKPKSRSHAAYLCLLYHTLESPNLVPLSLAILQQTLRSGCALFPQTLLQLSCVWMELRRSQSHSVRRILSHMKSMGYSPDTGTCNYLLSSLCSVDQITEAVRVLKGMVGAKCIPDSDSYGTVIKSMCKFRRTVEAVNMVKQMVEKYELTPRQGSLFKVVSALRARKDIWRAVEMIEFLEREGQVVGFKCYELVVRGCIQYREYILAAKLVMRMTEKRLVPHIDVRLKLLEGLDRIGELKLACIVRQRFAELRS